MNISEYDDFNYMFYFEEEKKNSFKYYKFYIEICLLVLGLYILIFDIYFIYYI